MDGYCLAQEKNNPLTPLELTINRIKNKYTEQVVAQDQNNFKENLIIINNQIKQIENLVNEFSDFARMPKPVFKNNDLVPIINENIRLSSEFDKSVKINFIKSNEKILLNCDKEQLSRVFFNLIKNSIESIIQKSENDGSFDKKISIEIFDNNDHIRFILVDNGIGFDQIKNDLKKITNPYFTTKKNGTGLGLSIVNKIINDHNGELLFLPISNGAKIEIIFKIDVNRNLNS